MWIHDAPTGTIDGVYTGISGQIANGQLVINSINKNIFDNQGDDQLIMIESKVTSQPSQSCHLFPVSGPIPVM